MSAGEHIFSRATWADRCCTGRFRLKRRFGNCGIRTYSPLFGRQTLDTGQQGCVGSVYGSVLDFRTGRVFAEKFSPFQFFEGRIGRGTKPPPQLLHTFASTSLTHSAQNVHSKEQMRASPEAGGSGMLQCSHEGRSSSIDDLLLRSASRPQAALVAIPV